MLRLVLLVAFLVQLLAFGAAAQKSLPANNASLAPNAPADRPVTVAATSANAQATMAAFERHITPAIKEARTTLPQAKKRFLQGLPDGQAFYVTTRISDPSGPYEQVFIRVKQWENKRIQGFIASQLDFVKTYQQNQLITFSTSDVFDWTISHLDGTEEGNYIGKLLDADAAGH